MATHPGDHEPVWNPLGDEWRACTRCGHIDGGRKWVDRLIVNVVMAVVVCFVVVWIGYGLFSLVR